MSNAEYFVIQRQRCVSCEGTRERAADFWNGLWQECAAWQAGHPKPRDETDNVYKERIYTAVHLPYFIARGYDPGDPKFYEKLPPKNVWCEDCEGTGHIESYVPLAVAQEALRPRRGKKSSTNRRGK